MASLLVFLKSSVNAMKRDMYRETKQMAAVKERTRVDKRQGNRNGVGYADSKEKEATRT